MRNHYMLRLVLCLAFILGSSSCGPTLEERQRKAEIQYELGAAELNRGGYTEALDAFEEARRLYGDDPRVYNGLGLLSLQQRQYDAAILQFNKALSLDPNFTEAHNNLGTTYAQMQKWDEAIFEFRATLSDPFYRTPELAYYNLGLALMEKGDLIGAVKELHAAVQLKHEFSQALDKYGVALFRLNRIQEAVKQFNQAIENDPAYFEPRLNLGLAYMKQGKKMEAIRQFKFILENAREENLKESAKRYLEILE